MKHTLAKSFSAILEKDCLDKNTYNLTHSLHVMKFMKNETGAQIVLCFYYIHMYIGICTIQQYMNSCCSHFLMLVICTPVTRAQ